ncbi:MAG: ATP-grasp domain-containing protein [bacterium]
MKTLWILSGGIEAVPGIQRAREMGLFVVVSDGDPGAPGLQLADHAVIASTYDVEANLAAARQFQRCVRPIDGVMSVAADVPLTMAFLAAEFDLPGISIETARLSADKLAMKERFARSGIPIPWFRAVESVQDVRRIVSERGYPLVIKPVDSRGARGVLRLTPEIDLNWAFAHSLSFSRTSRVMIEEYLPGPQVSTESVLLDGVGFTPGLSDRNYEYLERFAPYMIENGGQLPSELPRKDQETLASLAEKAALAMGIRNGTAKGDLVLTADGPKVIEMAARLSGGWFSTVQIPLATGVDLLGAAIRLALGEPVEAGDLRPEHQRGVAIRYFFPAPGRVTAIREVERFLQQPWVHRLQFFVGEGDFVEPTTNHTRRAGFVITSGVDGQEALARAELVVNKVAIDSQLFHSDEMKKCEYPKSLA